MLTPEQERWLAHLSDQDAVTIRPYDPDAPRIFEVVKRRVQAALGPQTVVEHRGATGLGISGQDEIDIYVPVPSDDFDDLLSPLAVVFGPPRSHYHNRRARFVTVAAGKHVDIFLINAQSEDWRNGLRFENYLRTHPETLEQYRLLKEAGNGLSTREYYRRKLLFINRILALC